MKVVKAEIGHADVIGKVHSEAWKQAYKDVFPEEYLNEDTSDKRTREFIESCNSKDIIYYVIYEEQRAVGIVKVICVENESCEISSFYILDKYRNKGYGKQVIVYLKNAFEQKKFAYGY